MKLKLLTLVSLLVLAHTAPAQTAGDKPATTPPVKAGPSQEAIDRRARSVERLSGESVTIPGDLPVIADSTTARMKTRDEIAQRAIAVCLAALKAEGATQDTIDDLVKRYKAKKF